MLSWRKESGTKKEGEKTQASPAPVPNRASKSADPSASGVSGAAPTPSSPDLGVGPETSAVPQTRLRLGEILVSEGVITQAQLDEALEKKEKEGGFLGQTLVDLKYIHRETLISFLVKQCKIPHLSLLDYQFNEELFKYIPKETCLKHSLLPIDRLGKILTVAMVDPLDIDALEAVRTACPDLKIKPILCDWYHYETVARRVLEKKGERAEETASSFGLSERPKSQPATTSDTAKKPEAQDKPASAPAAPPPRTPAVPPRPTAEVPSGASGANADELAALVRQTAHDAVQEAMAGVVEAVQSARPTAGESAAGLSAAVAESVREAMREMITMLDERIQSSPSAETGVSAADLAAAMRESVREAMTGMEAARSKDQPVQAHSGPSSEQLAAAIGESMRGAMRDIVSLLDERVPKAGPAVAAQATAADLASILRDGIRDAIREASPMLAGGQGAVDLSALETAREALARQESKLREAAEAASQAAKAAEAAALEKSEQRVKYEAERRRRHATVTPLNKAERDALEAIDGPGLRTRADDRVHDALASERPLAGYTFDGYIVGKANNFTIAIGKAVAEKPGGEYNPFFLYGDVGIGKTHLINAIGNHILNAAPDQRVGYVSSSRFASALMDAIQDHALEAFRENYCHWDVLILDDIQFMSGRVEAQEEFFHIFNALHQESRQIIIAGDKPPDQLGQLEKRLVSRFAGGIVASLRPPEWETRMAILRRQVADGKVKVPEEVLSLIATRIPNDVRKMSGSLRKVAAFASLVGQEVTCDLATEILSHLGLDEVA